MITQTQTRLRSLRLTGMADALEVQREHPGTYESLSFEERLALLVDQEDAERNGKRLARLLKVARFKLAATVEAIDYEQARSISQSQMTTLVTCDWIRRKQNLLIIGSCGTGKSWHSCNGTDLRSQSLYSLSLRACFLEC